MPHKRTHKLCHVNRNSRSGNRDVGLTVKHCQKHPTSPQIHVEMSAQLPSFHLVYLKIAPRHPKFKQTTKNCKNRHFLEFPAQRTNSPQFRRNVPQFSPILKKRTVIFAQFTQHIQPQPHLYVVISKIHQHPQTRVSCSPFPCSICFAIFVSFGFLMFRF